MISNAQLKELLAQKTETRNLDFKESFNWLKFGNDEKCQLVKDLPAFLNTLGAPSLRFLQGRVRCELGPKTPW
jgi:hypothetical protein